MNEHLFGLAEAMSVPHGTPNSVTVYKYTYKDGRQILYNITKALEIIKNKPREPKLLIDELDQFKRIREEFDLEEEKLKHADCTIPGIVSYIIADNEPTLIFIDGLHRAAKAYENGFTQYAYLLDFDESRECVIACSEGCVP